MNQQEWTSGKLLSTSGSYWQACTLHAAVKLDIFSRLGRDFYAAAEIASWTGGNLRGVTMLLNALTAMNLLTRKDGLYGNSPAATSFLSTDSPDYLGHMILHHYYLMESWSHLDEGIRSGKPQRSRSSHNSTDRRESFLMGMFNIAMQVAPRVAAEISLTDRRCLLDMGGGPGTYAVHFCLVNPKLRATVYDLPETRPFAEKTIAKFGLSERIDFQAGDYLKDKIKGVYDVVLLSHILHAESPENCRKIIRKAVSVTKPGGLIIIHEFILNDSMDGPLHPALFALNMLLGTSGGQAYSEAQLRDMLAEAGVGEIRRIPLQTPNDSGLVCGFINK